MTTRLIGLGLVLIGVVVAVLFVYFPIRDGGNGFMGMASVKAMVFIPLAIVAGLAITFGGPSVLSALQARPKTKQQTALVLSIIVGSGILTGIGYWQIKSRWMREPEPVILEVPKFDVPPVRQR